MKHTLISSLIASLLVTACTPLVRGVDSEENANTGSSATGAPFEALVNGQVTTIALDGSGNTFIGGSFNRVNFTNFTGLAKITKSNGALDPTFSIGSGFDSHVYTIAKLSDGGFIIGGAFATYRGSTVNNIVRLDSSGNIVTSFNDPAGTPGFDSTVNKVLVDEATDSVYAAGSFTTFKGANVSAIARISLATGVLDTGFNTGATLTNASIIGDILLDTATDNLYLVGNFSSCSMSTDPYICKLDVSNPSAPVNAPGFTTTALMGDGPAGVPNIIESDGTYIYVGDLAGAYTYNGAPIVNGTIIRRFIRLSKTTGTPDTAFPAVPALDSNFALTGIVFDGTSVFTASNGAAARATIGEVHKYDAGTGVLDAGFGGDGIISFSGGGVDMIGTTASDHLYLGGGFSHYEATDKVSALIALDKSNGSLVSAFGNSGTTTAIRPIYDIAFSGTAMYIAGSIGTNGYGGSVANNIAKFNSARELDTTFSPQGTSPNGFDANTREIIHESGKLYVVGNFTRYRATAQNYIAKIDATTGVLDPTFAINSGAGADSFLSDLVSSGTGDFFVSGYHSNYAGAPVAKIFKISNDGTPDAGFTADPNAVPGITGADGIAFDGTKIFASTWTSNPRGASVFYLGALDATTGASSTDFNFFDGVNYVARAISGSATLLTLAGSNLFASGAFTTYEGAPATNLAKINSTTGALDTAIFNPALGPNGMDSTPNSITYNAANQTMLVTGNYTSILSTTGLRGLASVDAATGAVVKDYSSWIKSCEAPEKAIESNGYIYYSISPSGRGSVDCPHPKFYIGNVETGYYP